MPSVYTALNLLGLGGLAAFVYWTIRGLRERIQALTTLAEEQHKTLEAVRTRAIELDQLRKDYKQALDDFQDVGQKLQERKNLVIAELEEANRQKDDELARLKRLELEEIRLREQSLQRLPALEQQLTTVVKELERQVRIVASGSLRRSNIFLVATPADRPRFEQASLFDYSRDYLRHGWLTHRDEDHAQGVLLEFLRRAAKQATEDAPASTPAQSQSPPPSGEKDDPTSEDGG